MNNCKKIVIALFITISTLSFAESTTPPTITIGEAIDLAIKNNPQFKVAEEEINTAVAKREQARSGYFPKVKLGGGATLFSDTPDLVVLANKLADLNNAVDGTMDIISTEQLKLTDFYKGMAQLNAKDPTLSGAYTNTAGMYSQLSQKSKYIADLMSQKPKKDDSHLYFGWKMSFEQPLYTGNKLTAINKQAEENINLVKSNIEVSKNNIIFEAKKSFYTVIQAQRFVHTAEEGVKSMEEHYTEAKSYYKAGLVPNIDVIRAETKLAELKQKLINAKNGLELAKTAFNFNIGGALTKDYIFYAPLSYTQIKDDLETCKRNALKNRPEIKQINSKIEMAKYNVEIASSAGRPMVALTGDLEQKDPTPFGKSPQWSISLMAGINIFDGNQVNSQIKESQATVEQAQKGKELLQKGIELEVTQSYLNLQNAIEAITASKSNITQAQETLKLAALNYKAGLGSSMDKIDAEMGLILANNNLTQALSQYEIALAQLEKSTGIEKEEYIK